MSDQLIEYSISDLLSRKISWVEAHDPLDGKPRDTEQDIGIDYHTGLVFPASVDGALNKSTASLLGILRLFMFIYSQNHSEGEDAHNELRDDIIEQIGNGLTEPQESKLNYLQNRRYENKAGLASTVAYNTTDTRQSYLYTSLKDYYDINDSTTRDTFHIKKYMFPYRCAIGQYYANWSYHTMDILDKIYDIGGEEFIQGVAGGKPSRYVKSGLLSDVIGVKSYGRIYFSQFSEMSPPEQPIDPVTNEFRNGFSPGSGLRCMSYTLPVRNYKGYITWHNIDDMSFVLKDNVGYQYSDEWLTEIQWRRSSFFEDRHDDYFDISYGSGSNILVSVREPNLSLIFPITFSTHNDAGAFPTDIFVDNLLRSSIRHGRKVRLSVMHGKNIVKFVSTSNAVSQYPSHIPLDDPIFRYIDTATGNLKARPQYILDTSAIHCRSIFEIDFMFEPRTDVEAGSALYGAPALIAIVKLIATGLSTSPLTLY